MDIRVKQNTPYPMPPLFQAGVRGPQRQSGFKEDELKKVEKYFTNSKGQKKCHI